MPQLTLAPAQGRYAEDLVVLLNTDHVLIEKLRMGRAAQSVVEFEAFYKRWAQVNRAHVHAVVEDGRAIGMAMLAYRDYLLNTARIIYWLGSAHWDQDYANAAFACVLLEAQQMGLRTVTGMLRDDEPLVMRAWEKNGAACTHLGDGRIYMDITL
nr:GNAT family N-acetyltransferase [Maliibacterium massiliense]